VRRQQVALAAEVKAVLDSWVRFEQQQKENEQARLVKTIVDSVLKNVSEEKTQKDVLVWAVSEVEREYPFPFSFFSPRHVSDGWLWVMVQSWSRPRRYRSLETCGGYVDRTSVFAQIYFCSSSCREDATTEP
jgi:hypothetical protein